MRAFHPLPEHAEDSEQKITKEAKDNIVLDLACRAEAWRRRVVVLVLEDENEEEDEDDSALSFPSSGGVPAGRGG